MLGVMVLVSLWEGVAVGDGLCDCEALCETDVDWLPVFEGVAVMEAVCEAFCETDVDWLPVLVADADADAEALAYTYAQPDSQ